MVKEVRYFSKNGSTKKIAEAIAEGAGVQALSVTDEQTLDAKIDVLFLGGAPYANIMAPELKSFAQSLDKSKVSKVALFTTSNWSRRTVFALKRILKKKGIEVQKKFLYVHVLKVDKKISEAQEFGKLN